MARTSTYVIVRDFFRSECNDAMIKTATNKSLELLRNSGDYFPCATFHITAERKHWHYDLEVSAFPNFKQNSDDESSASSWMPLSTETILPTY